MRHAVKIIVAFLSASTAVTLRADSVKARCDIYPAGSDRAQAVRPCVFSQRQGHIRILTDDAVAYDFSPVDKGPGSYTDSEGRAVYRQSGLGDQGLIFRTANESVYVYWSLNNESSLSLDTNATAPFSPDEYDATTLLSCRASGEPEYRQCPAGILRLEDQQASIVVLSPSGEQFTINFMTNYVNATNRELEAQLEGDTWTLTFANGEVWEVPVAAVTGG